MRELFNIDTKDYNPDGKVFTRPSARAVILREQKVLLVYSKKYDYYKFPGGGIKKGEKPQEALLREVAEETGYKVLPETVREYGRVFRRQRDSHDENGIFEQENLYYFCETCSDRTSTNLDDYEREEGFTPIWIDPMTASKHNIDRRPTDGADQVIIERDAKVLEMLAHELPGSATHFFKP